MVRVLLQLTNSRFFALTVVKLIDGMSEWQIKYFNSRKLSDLNSNNTRSDVLGYFLELINLSLKIYSVDIFKLLKNLIKVSSEVKLLLGLI